MKKMDSDELDRARRPADRSLGKTAPQNKSKGKSAPARPVRAGTAAKATGLLAEHSLAPEKVATRLRLYSPQAHEVFVAGSFNDWQPRATPLTGGPEGEWTVELSFKPGRYEYRYVVDGQWTNDPTAARFAANPFGGLNSVLEIQWPASTPAFSESAQFGVRDHP